MAAPVVLFTYNRPDLTARTVRALAANPLADQTDLIVFSDAARRPADQEGVYKVRQIFSGLDGFRSVRLIARAENMGLARSILAGVSAVLEEHGSAIILEDDLETSPHFLAFMNLALETYAADERVAAVSGYVPPVDGKLPETFFLREADCWGWATWRRAWRHFRADGASLLQDLQSRKLTDAFDYHGGYPYMRMLQQQIAGANNSWAIRWRASVFLNDMLTLYPGRSLVRNLGFDGSGTHSDMASFWDGPLSENPITVARQDATPSITAFAAFQRFYLRHTGYRLTRRLLRYGRRLLAR